VTCYSSIYENSISLLATFEPRWTRVVKRGSRRGRLCRYVHTVHTYIHPSIQSIHGWVHPLMTLTHFAPESGNFRAMKLKRKSVCICKIWNSSIAIINMIHARPIKITRRRGACGTLRIPIDWTRLFSCRPVLQNCGSKKANSNAAGPTWMYGVYSYRYAGLTGDWLIVKKMVDGIDQGRCYMCICIFYSGPTN